MRKIIIGSIVGALAFLIAGIFYLGRNTGQDSRVPAQSGATLPLAAPLSTGNGADLSMPSDTASSTPTGATLTIGTNQGSITVKNFYLSNPQINEAGDYVLETTTNYAIVYLPTYSGFWIGVSSTPFSSWRIPAEADFLSLLAITKSQACDLSVSEGVIYSPSNPDDGSSFPLSFCGNAFQGR